MFSPWCSKSNFMLEKRFLVKHLSGFDQHTAKSPWQCPFNPVLYRFFTEVRALFKRAATLFELLQKDFCTASYTNYTCTIVILTPFKKRWTWTLIESQNMYIINVWNCAEILPSFLLTPIWNKLLLESRTSFSFSFFPFPLFHRLQSRLCHSWNKLIKTFQIEYHAWIQLIDTAFVT